MKAVNSQQVTVSSGCVVKERSAAAWAGRGIGAEVERGISATLARGGDAGEWVWSQAQADRKPPFRGLGVLGLSL